MKNLRCNKESFSIRTGKMVLLLNTDNTVLVVL